MNRKAIIGGTGVYDVMEGATTQSIVTAYGDVSYDLVKIGDTEVIFLARHGKEHNLPPHKINYRANMMALKMLEVDEIMAICAVGSMNDAYEPGDIVVINDFMDFTKNRIQTFFDGDTERVAHVEMTDPYCNRLRGMLVHGFEAHALNCKGNAVYVCTEGPRFETAAEIRMYRQLGGDVVGMTNIPESVLAKELGICYAAVGVITNWCTGIEGKAIAGHQITASMNQNKEKLTRLFLELLSRTETAQSCKCQQSLIIV